LDGERSCRVGFITPDRGTPNQALRYAVTLRENSKTIGTGSTENPEDAVACTTSWVGEKLSLEDLYVRFDLVNRNRRALRLLAKHIDKAQTEVGSQILTTLEDSSSHDFTARLWIYGDRRTCHLQPLKGNKQIKCSFVSDGIHLATAELSDEDATARAVNLWLDQNLTLDELGRDIPNLAQTDFASVYESGDVQRWRWLKLMKTFSESRYSEFYNDYIPILETLIEIPEVYRFFPHTDQSDIRFSRCSHEPYIYSGMPVINHRHSGFIARCDGEKIEGHAQQIIDFVTRCLARVSKPPFIGRADDVLLDPVNSCLEEQGRALRVERIWRGARRMISASRGERTCDLSINELFEACYHMYFHTGARLDGIGNYKTLTGFTGALHMWLEQGCTLEDLAAVADKFHDTSRK